MALRRLMSGWLIALAAMARATAAALERAAAERSAPAVDPILAELGERYPDAPAHWLTFVAERMSRAADAVEMSSAPAESEAERLSAPEPLMAVAPGSMFADGPPPGPAPITPGFRPARRREEAATPSLAELASRSSEVWRRPSGSPNRPSRPVFARPAEAATPTVAATARNDAPTTVHRSRSPLRVDPGAASRIRPDRSPVDSEAFDLRPSDLGQPLAATPPDRALSAEPATAASLSMTPAKRSARNPGSNDLLPMTGEAVREPPGTRRVQAASKTGSETALRGPLFDPTPPSPSRSRPPTREPAARAARPPPRDSSISEAEAPPCRRGQPRPFAAVRSAARRMIVRTVAALGPRVASASHHLAPAGKPPSVTPPTIIRSPRRSTSASAPTSATTGENGAAPAEIRAPRVEGREVSVEAAPWSPRRRTAQVGGDRTQDEPAPVRRTESRARELAPAFVRPPAPRASLAARRASPALGRTHGAALSGDDRWPSLPPIFLPPPPEVEAPAPRLHRLARDQEEGLWSA